MFLNGDMVDIEKLNGICFLIFFVDEVFCSQRMKTI